MNGCTAMDIIFQRDQLLPLNLMLKLEMSDLIILFPEVQAEETSEAATGAIQDQDFTIQDKIRAHECFALAVII